MVRDVGFRMGSSIGSPAELLSHTLSLVIFVIIYMLLCWRILRAPQRISTLQSLVRWMALVWLVYCAIGSSWFWPRYIPTLFLLFSPMEPLPAPTDSCSSSPLPPNFSPPHFSRPSALF